MQETYKINDLEQIRLLSDPLKLQLLQAFAEGAKTTKQVAAELGESVTKLYRHVDALHDAGLLEIARETPKRGTVERTFRAVAQRFEAEPDLFTDAGDDDAGAMRDLVRAAEDEIVVALTRERSGDAIEPVMMRLRCRASPERIRALRQSLLDWVEAAQAADDEEQGETRDAGAVIAFYPLGD